MKRILLITLLVINITTTIQTANNIVYCNDLIWDGEEVVWIKKSKTKSLISYFASLKNGQNIQAHLSLPSRGITSTINYASTSNDDAFTGGCDFHVDNPKDAYNFLKNNFKEYSKPEKEKSHDQIDT